MNYTYRYLKAYISTLLYIFYLPKIADLIIFMRWKTFSSQQSRLIIIAHSDDMKIKYSSVINFQSLTPKVQQSLSLSLFSVVHVLTCQVKTDPCMMCRNKIIYHYIKTIEGKTWFEILNLDSNKFNTHKQISGSYMIARSCQKEEGNILFESEDFNSFQSDTHFLNRIKLPMRLDVGTDTT